MDIIPISIISSLVLLAIFTRWLLDKIEDRQNKENRNEISKRGQLIVRILIPLFLFLIGICFMMKEEEDIEMDSTSFRKGLKRIREERYQLAKNLSKR